MFLETSLMAVNSSLRLEATTFLPVLPPQLKSSKKDSTMNFEIEGEGANSIFTVDRGGDLFVTTSLDREKKASYNLTARMYDKDNNLVEDAGHFVIHVTDINDNSPVFSQTFNGYIMERSKIGM